MPVELLRLCDHLSLSDIEYHLLDDLGEVVERAIRLALHKGSLVSAQLREYAAGRAVGDQQLRQTRSRVSPPA